MSGGGRLGRLGVGSLIFGIDGLAGQITELRAIGPQDAALQGGVEFARVEAHLIHDIGNKFIGAGAQLRGGVLGQPQRGVGQTRPIRA